MSQAEARGEGESARDEQYENELASIISGALVDCGDAVVPSWESCLYVARRVLSVASPAAQSPDAKPVATLICPKCGVDRFKSPCGNASHIMTCPLQGVALAAPQPPAGKGERLLVRCFLATPLPSGSRA
jgi:hypothetical protein